MPMILRSPLDVIIVKISVVGVAVERRHQNLDVPPDDFLGAIAEQLLAGRIEHQHAAARIDQDHAVHCGVDDGPQPISVGLVRTGDAILHAHPKAPQARGWRPVHTHRLIKAR